MKICKKLVKNLCELCLDAVLYCCAFKYRTQTLLNVNVGSK